MTKTRISPKYKHRIVGKIFFKCCKLISIPGVKFLSNGWCKVVQCVHVARLEPSFDYSKNSMTSKLSGSQKLNVTVAKEKWYSPLLFEAAAGVSVGKFFCPGGREENCFLLLLWKCYSERNYYDVVTMEKKNRVSKYRCFEVSVVSRKILCKAKTKSRKRLPGRQRCRFWGYVLGFFQKSCEMNYPKYLLKGLLFWPSGVIKGIAYTTLRNMVRKHNGTAKKSMKLDLLSAKFMTSFDFWRDRIFLLASSNRLLLNWALT